MEPRAEISPRIEEPYPSQLNLALHRRELEGDLLGLAVARDRDHQVDVFRGPWLGPNGHGPSSDQRPKDAQGSQIGGETEEGALETIHSK